MTMERSHLVQLLVRRSDLNQHDDDARYKFTAGLYAVEVGS